MTAARSKTRSPWKFFIVSTFIVLSLTFFSLFFTHESIPTRIGVVIVGDPIIVFSYDQERKIILAVSVPSDTYVDVARGYGSYPISSVWKLDHMDKRRGVVLTETVEEALGIPVRFYINPSSLTDKSESIGARIGNAVSFLSSTLLIFGKTQTNIPSGILFELSRVVSSMSPTDMTFFDLAKQAVFSDSTLADGTKVRKIDSGKLALVLGTHAEDAKIRRENLRIAVYNTTNSSGLAQKVARTMEGSGFHVSSIANDQTLKTSRCIIRGNKEIQITNTVKTLQWLYGCIFNEDVKEFQSDISFFIGTDYEKRFFPF